jgi:hypothetical protein
MLIRNSNEHGSILVIGGQTTVAGAASHKLELLPSTGGGLVRFDWLVRTDPNNLYTILCVLSSGGIFAAYYNEALILQPVTFETTKQLPNMPARSTISSLNAFIRLRGS